MQSNKTPQNPTKATENNHRLYRFLPILSYLKHFVNLKVLFLLFFFLAYALVSSSSRPALAKKICDMDANTMQIYSKNDILYFCPHVVEVPDEEGGSPGESCSLSGAASDNASRILSILLDYGYSDTAAAAIIGNLRHESGLDPYNLEDGLGSNDSIVVDDSFRLLDSSGVKTYSGGFGLAQWTDKGRVKNLQAFADSHGKPVTSLELQVEFLIHEIETSYSSVLPSALNSLSVDQATQVFMEKFESPNPAFANLSTRQRYAREVLEGNDIICVETPTPGGTPGSSPSVPDSSPLSSDQRSWIDQYMSDARTNSNLSTYAALTSAGSLYADTLVNCTAFSVTYVGRFGSHGKIRQGNGKEIVSIMLSSGYSSDSGPVVNSIFSTGVTSSAGHTGLIIGNDGTTLTIAQAAWKNLERTTIYTISISDFNAKYPDATFAMVN